MGYTVLYIAFGIVALWLLGEVLLQYKAPLLWRVLAFAGFVGVVVGVARRDVVVIALGTVTFAIGQTFVTINYRQGYSMGWALGGGPGESGRRRRPGMEDDGRSEPRLRVTEVEPVGARAEAPGYVEAPVPVYHPQALNDDTGEYAAYDRQQAESQEQPQQPSYRGASYADPYAGQDPLGGGYGGGYDGGYGGGLDGGGYDGYGGSGGYGGADQTSAMPAYQDPGVEDPAYQDQTAAMPLFRDGAYQDQTAAMPAYQDPGFDPGYRDNGYQTNGYQDNGYPGGYGQDQGGDLGRGAYLPPEAGQYQQPQATYLDPNQYEPQAPPQPQYDPQPPPPPGYDPQPPPPPGYDPQPEPQAQPYPDVYGDLYGTPPGGVWVPQQQNGDQQQYYPPPPPDPYRY